MKRQLLWLVAALLVVAVLSSGARPQRSDELSKFMRVKLVQAHKVLEGLTTEDYGMIAKFSQDMSLLSQQANWQVLQTPDYLQRSIDFRRSVDSLTEAAKNKNLDGAALAYLEVTLKCVECHKYLRRQREEATSSPQRP